MPDDFQSFGDIIRNSPGLGNVRKVIKESDVIFEFSTVFPDLQKIATAVKVEKKTLFLRVENSVWRSELKFKEKIIIDEINKHFKEERIKWVRFTT